jgi:hypothetical protein
MNRQPLILDDHAVPRNARAHQRGRPLHRNITGNAQHHIDDPGPWLKAFGYDPRLRLSRPAPLAAPQRLNDLAPINKSIATIRHAKPPSAHADLLAGT